MARGSFSTSNFFRSTTLPVTAAPFTVFILAKANTTTGDARVWGLYSSSSTVEYFNHTLNSDNTVDFTARSAAAGDNRVATTNTVTDGQWYRAVLVARAADDRSVWLDGDDSGRGDDTGSVTPTVDRHSVGCLDRSSAQVSGFDGDVALVVVWNAALSNGECIAMGRGGNPLRTSPDNIVDVYWFEGTGDVNSMSASGATMVEQGTVAYATPGPLPPLWGFDEQWEGAFTAAGGAPADQEPALIGGKLVGNGLLTKHLVR